VSNATLIPLSRSRIRLVILAVILADVVNRIF